MEVSGIIRLVHTKLLAQGVIYRHRHESKTSFFFTSEYMHRQTQDG